MRRKIVFVGAVLAVLCGAGVLFAGTEGTLQLPKESVKKCERTTSFEVDWSNREVRARRVVWGVIGATQYETGVRAPFQKPNVFLPCGAKVRLVAEFAQTPKRLRCRIVVGGKEFTPTVPSDKLGRRCVVETTVPA